MGRRNKNTFSKALGHLKSRKIDEKIQMLSERPANSTLGYMTAVGAQSNPNFISTQQGQENALAEVRPDFTVDGPDDQTGYDGKDTTGLFKEDGTPRTAMPPGDTSYILGPMSAMWYAWANQTRIGYIRQSDRKMQNLGYITGKLSDWDGSSGVFYSYGQLTLDQANWFRTVQKQPGATNDPSTYNYRAFYPGPPSTSRDAFGRYYCVVTGEPLGDPLPGVGEKEVNPGEGGPQDPTDTFALIMDRIRAGETLSKAEREFLKKRLPNPLSIIGNRMGKEAFAMDPDEFRNKYGLNPEDVQDYYRNYYGSQPATTPPPIPSSDMTPSQIDSYINSLPDGIKNDILNPTRPDYSMEALVAALIPQTKTLSAAISKVSAVAKALNRWWNKGRNVRVKNESSASWQELLADDFAQKGKSDLNFQSGKPGNPFGRPDQAFNIFRPAAKGGPGSGPTPAVRQAFERLLKPFMLKLQSSKTNQNNQSNLSSDENKNNTGNTKASGPMVSFTPAESQVSLDISNIEVRLSADKATNVNRTQNEINADKQQLKVLKARAEELKKQREALNKRRASGEEVGESEYKNIGQTKTSPKNSNNNNNEISLFGAPQDPFANEPKPNLGAKDGDELASANYDLYNWMIKTYGMPAAEWKLNNPGLPDSSNPHLAPGSYVPKAQKNINKKSTTMIASYQRKGKVLSESRKSDIIKNLKKPVVLPETKKKSYKVKPKYKTLNTVISKPVATPEEYKPPMKMWGRYEYNKNVRDSQERMNEVMNLLGEGEAAMQYRLKNGTTRTEQEMKEFWGKHPELYDFYFNGMNHRMLRKEQVEGGDFVVFLVAENGKKVSMSQSKLNEKLAEAEDQKLLDEYNKLNPKSEPISFEQDPLFKKVSKRLKSVTNYSKKPSPKGYPDKAPPKMVNGFHPDLGKRYKYDKLDPQSAEAMPPQGNPEIDANIEKFTDKNAKIRKIKNLLGKRT